MVAVRGLAAEASLLVVVGMVIDALDGRAARWLHAESAFGKQLDSLSDIITFGLVPSMIMYLSVLHTEGTVGMAVAIAFPVCGALRLARFNVQRGSSHYFVGLPITAAGGILATLTLYRSVLSPSDIILPIAMLALSALMVSRVRYPNFKKIAFPKSAVIVVPGLAILVYALFRIDHSAASRLVFVPLALYGLLGCVRLIRRRHKRLLEAEQEAKAIESTLK